MSNKQYILLENLEKVVVIEQSLYTVELFKDFKEVYTYLKGYFVTSYIGKKLSKEKELNYEEIL